MPKLSIIVPVYNVEKYLCKCIDSILNQTFKDFELILVDDGSTDRCGVICDDYAKKDYRVKVIHKKNGGLSSARNTGLDVAKGQYIGFVDSDDYIDIRMYEIMLNHSIEHESDIVICDFRYVKEDDNIEKSILRQNIEDIQVENMNNIRALESLYMRNAVSFEVSWNKLYKKKLFEGIRFEEGRIHEDSIIIHDLFYKCNKVTHIKCCLYSYLMRENSITSSSFTIKNLDGIYALKKRMDFFYEKNLMDLKYKAQYDYIVRFIRDYYKAKENMPNERKLLKYLKLNFNKIWLELFKNPYYNWKEKLAIYLFIINPYLYKIYVKR